MEILTQIVLGALALLIISIIFFSFLMIMSLCIDVFKDSFGDAFGDMIYSIKELFRKIKDKRKSKKKFYPFKKK